MASPGLPAPPSRLCALPRLAKAEKKEQPEPADRGPREAAAAALAASVAFFKRRPGRPPRPPPSPRPRGLLLLLQDYTPPAILSIATFVLSILLPQRLVALFWSLFVLLAAQPRRREEVPAVDAAPDPGSNDVAEVSLLNTAVQEMWPEITSFIRTVLKETVEEAIQTRVPWFLKSLGFGRISFGDSALKVEQLDVERLMQASNKADTVRSFKVSSLVAWDADVDVALTAPGAALSAEHVLVKGRLDVCLQQILPRPPFFTGISFYFADVPKVVLTLDGTLVGVRVSLSWLERLLADIIQKQLAEQIVLPTVAAVLLDVTNEDAWFDAGHVFPEGVITVVVHSASKLAAKDMALPFGLSQPSSDPYCKLSLGGSSWRTPTRPQNLNPRWTEAEASHQFLVHSRSEQQLLLQVYDENPYTEDAALGFVSLPVSDVKEAELELQEGQGTVTISSRWEDLRLEESNVRAQMRALDGTNLKSTPAFVVFVGIDSCIFKDSEVSEKKQSYTCKVSCEDHEDTVKSRRSRKRGRYGATAWWRRGFGEGEEETPEEVETIEEAHNVANFQATFTHLMKGDPRSALVHVKVEKKKRGPLPGQDVVGELYFPVFRLIHAAGNTTKVTLPLGEARLSLIAQLRATGFEPKDAAKDSHAPAFKDLASLI
ncbi:unnamed protein product [Effrenium voratum]|nr:unnamed protein product [Effrenium voratum]